MRDKSMVLFGYMREAGVKLLFFVVILGFIYAFFFVSVFAQTIGACEFSRPLTVGVIGEDVRCLQRYLNNAGFFVAVSGAGSPGNETTFFGPLTRLAVVRWQAANAISPAAGYFGGISQKKYKQLAGTSIPKTTLSDLQAAPLSSSTQPSFSLPTVSLPMIISITPQTIRRGEVVTILGDGFTETGNTIVAQFGPIVQTENNALSRDGKTISFVFSPPKPQRITAEDFNKLPSSALMGLNQTLSSRGLSLGDLVENINTPYQGIHSEQELDAILQQEGRSITDLRDPFVVTVKNARGETRAPYPIHAIRDFSFTN